MNPCMQPQLVGDASPDLIVDATIIMRNCRSGCIIFYMYNIGLE